MRAKEKYGEKRPFGLQGRFEVTCCYLFIFCRYHAAHESIICIESIDAFEVLWVILFRVILPVVERFLFFGRALEMAYITNNADLSSELNKRIESILSEYHLVIGEINIDLRRKHVDFKLSSLFELPPSDAVDPKTRERMATRLIHDIESAFARSLNMPREEATKINNHHYFEKSVEAQIKGLNPEDAFNLRWAIYNIAVRGFEWSSLEKEAEPVPVLSQRDNMGNRVSSAVPVCIIGGIING
jgi:hypothetical protein